MLRAQVFAGDALSHVAFVGAIAAAVVGLDELVGIFVLTLALAAGMAALGRRARADDVVIGIVFTWILGLGLLFITLLATSASGGSGITTANTLFGSIFSLGGAQARLAAVVGLALGGRRHRRLPAAAVLRPSIPRSPRYGASRSARSARAFCS